MSSRLKMRTCIRTYKALLYTHLRHCYRKNKIKICLYVLRCAFASFVIVYLKQCCSRIYVYLHANAYYCVYTHLHSHTHLMCKCLKQNDVQLGIHAPRGNLQKKKTLKHPETHPQRDPRRLEFGELSGQNWGPPQRLDRRLWSAPGACPPDS